ncbi:hypothetical protein SAMN05216388_101683 [Halorientalis persicus]|uniref:Uncharacterized protein n=1 Tax=Halorientalis persicus TaxID=1367881 RepID=A0A1H8RIM6_9EURY|nr:hypothetical protein [Halorientalis persicus]SEO66399.1 hypothetical protein SAMN05216388_101683 [Halorientalis persicus]
MYDKSILAKSTGASLGVVAIVGLLFVSTGTAFAMPVAGIGGFTISADVIEGEGMVLYPGSSDAENSTDVAEVNGSTGAAADQYPVGVVELDSTTIEGMNLRKVFDLQNNSAGLMPGKARIVISASGNVTSETLMMKTPQLAAENATFSGMEIDENTVDKADDITSWMELRTDQDPKGPLEGPASGFGEAKKSYSGGDGGPGMVMKDPYIRATYLATDSISIPGMALEVQYDNDNDGDYEWAS